MTAGAAFAPASAEAAPRQETAELPAGAHGAIVAYVEDVRRGKVTLMVEGHEVHVTDRKLVARLAHALHKAQRDAARAATSSTR